MYKSNKMKTILIFFRNILLVLLFILIIIILCNVKSLKRTYFIDFINKSKTAVSIEHGHADSEPIIAYVSNNVFLPIINKDASSRQSEWTKIRVWNLNEIVLYITTIPTGEKNIISCTINDEKNIGGGVYIYYYDDKSHKCKFQPFIND